MSDWDEWGELRVFVDWSAARWTHQERFDSPADFYTHLAGIGVEQPNALARYGYPGVEWFVPDAPAPPSVFTELRCLQVWQNFDPYTVAAFCHSVQLNAVMVKALDGAWYMGNAYYGNPANADEVADLRAFFHGQDLKFGCWTNPIYGPNNYLDVEASMTADVANNCDFTALDTEPYEGFWGAYRPVGAAARLVQGIRMGAPDAPLVWQPDPRPARLAELRPEEWAPAMSAWAGQHYYDIFGTDPVAEVQAAVNQRDMWVPNGALIPTFSLEQNTSAAIETATRALRQAGGDGWVLWRYGLPGQAELARAAVTGWGLG